MNNTPIHNVENDTEANFAIANNLVTINQIPQAIKLFKEIALSDKKSQMPAVFKIINLLAVQRNSKAITGIFNIIGITNKNEAKHFLNSINKNNCNTYTEFKTTYQTKVMIGWLDNFVTTDNPPKITDSQYADFNKILNEIDKKLAELEEMTKDIPYIRTEADDILECFFYKKHLRNFIDENKHPINNKEIIVSLIIKSLRNHFDDPSLYEDFIKDIFIDKTIIEIIKTKLNTYITAIN